MYRWCQKWNAFQTIFGSYLHFKKKSEFLSSDFWPLWPFKDRHPIQVNDLGSCHPMWPHHMIAWQLHFGISSKFKIFKTWNFMTEFHDSWRLQFHLKISSGEFQSLFLQILVLHLFSFLFFYSRPFFIISSSCLMDNLLFSVLYLLSYWQILLLPDLLLPGSSSRSSARCSGSEDLQNRTSTRSVGLL